MNNIVNINTNTDRLVTILSDFRDIEDSLIWVLEKMQEYQNPLIEHKLKELIIEINKLKDSEILSPNHGRK